MNNTIINQIIIQIKSGTTINMSQNLAISDFGQTLKSSIIYKRVVIHKNCNINESYNLYFDILSNNPAKLNNINEPIIEESIFKLLWHLLRA